MTEPDSRRQNLGRGLDALLGEESEDYASLDRVRSAKTVPVEFIRPSRVQPRHRFDEEELAGLTQSIKEKGVLQPVLVRRSSEDPTHYELIAGERRWRAAQAAQLHEIPVVIRDLNDSEALEIALVENLQRENLSPLEEAEGYRRLMEEFSHTQEKLAQTVGKSRSQVANMMRLLALPDPVKEMLETGALTAGHGRALLNADDPVALARRVVARGLNVRQTEKLVQRRPRAPRSPSDDEAPRRGGKTPDTMALEGELSTLLGLQVEINDQGHGGQLIIKYQTLEQLDDVLQRLTKGSR